MFANFDAAVATFRRVVDGLSETELLAPHPDDAGLLTASFLVKKREGQFRIDSVDCDVKGLQLTQTPRGDSDTFRFDISLPGTKLKPGYF